LGFGGAVFAGYVLGRNLGGLTPGLSLRELSLDQHTSTLSAILHNPVGLPLTALQWLIGTLPFHGLAWLRLASVLLGLSAIFCMTYIMRRWYGPRTALFGFFLFATSAWLLHVGRLATTDILYLWAIPTLLFAHLILHEHTTSKAGAYSWLLCNLLLLYVPGMVWFVLLNMWWQRAEIIEALQSFKSWLGRIGLTAFGLLLLAPLIYGLVVGPAKTVGLDLLGLPAAIPNIQTLGSNIRDALLFIAVHGNAPDDAWLNHLPILDAFLTITFITGLYFYATHLRASRTRLLGGFMLVGLVLLAVGGPITIGVIVPLLYLIAAAGIAYLLHLWLAVFPRNPLARGFGIGLLSLAVAASCLYGLRQYFVAWPHHPEMQTAFRQHKIEPSHR
jgi:hypothetical protein